MTAYLLSNAFSLTLYIIVLLTGIKIIRCLDITFQYNKLNSKFVVRDAGEILPRIISMFAGGGGKEGNGMRAV